MSDGGAIRPSISATWSEGESETQVSYCSHQDARVKSAGEAFSQSEEPGGMELP